jgi:hypothetical protein
LRRIFPPYLAVIYPLILSLLTTTSESLEHAHFALEGWQQGSANRSTVMFQCQRTFWIVLVCVSVFGITVITHLLC